MNRLYITYAFAYLIFIFSISTLWSQWSHGSARFVGRSFLPSWWGDVQLDDGGEEEDERQRPGPKSVGVTQAAACPGCRGAVPGSEMMG